jgi:DNA-binding transcriptional ArsR family regulator
MPVQQDLYEFMLEELGGQNAVYGKFYRQRIADLAAEGATLKDLRELAKADGWLDWLDGQRILEIASIAKADEWPTTRAVVPVKRTRGRMTDKEREELYRSVLEYLEANPWSSSRDIGDAIGFDPRKLGIHLKKLKEDGQLETEGIRSQMRYALAKGAE